jgi:hypothetical protein
VCASIATRVSRGGLVARFATSNISTRREAKERRKREREREKENERKRERERETRENTKDGCLMRIFRRAMSADICLNVCRGAARVPKGPLNSSQPKLVKKERVFFCFSTYDTLN